MEDKYIYKLIILGDTYVGKSTFISKYIFKSSDLNYNPTIGADFYTCLDRDISGRLIKCHIWDTAGQEMYRSITKGYFTRVVGAILMYDVTNYNSFLSLQYWINLLMEHTQLENLSVMIVGNKIDRSEHRCVTTKQGKEFASRYQATYIECSVLNGEKMYDIIPSLIDRISLTNFIDIDTNNETSGIKVLQYNKYEKEDRDNTFANRDCCVII
jgi:small GTP-binding protein